MSACPCRRTVRLLAVVWVAALCGADQPLPASTADHPHGQSEDPLDQLLTLVSRAVKTATEPIVAELNGQRALLEDIARRLGSQDSRLDSLDSRLDSRLDLVNSRLDSLNSGLGSRLDAFSSRLDTRLDSFSSQLDSRLDLVSSRLNSLNSALDSRQNSTSSQPDSASARLDSLNSELDSRLDAFSSRLESRLDSVSSRLDSLNSTLDSRQNSTSSQSDSTSSRLDSLNSELDSRLDAFSSRLDSVSSRLDGLSSPPRDCSDLPAGTQSGIQLVRPGLGGSAPVQVYCDMETDGGNWTVFQRRADILPRQDFYQDWRAYRDGFGELDAEFWWGLQNLRLMTAPLDRQYELRVDLEDFDGERRHAVYQNFRISSENDGYRITGRNYTGDAGDSLKTHFGKPFTTKDKDQDTNLNNCAQERKGAWWYHSCHESNLNGEYLAGITANDVYGVNWESWRGYHYSLKAVEIKIRPTRISA